jgi:23S rRNA (adenine2503-C2)-methyltransferase
MIYKSKLDESVNFEFKDMECRYVRRNEEKLSIYLSSQKGCKQACRFCFLTQKGLTKDTNVTVEEFEHQVDTVYDHYEKQPSAKRVNYNLMAKGEPLENTELIRNFATFYELCESKADYYGLDFKINISTILPSTSSITDLEQLFLWSNVRIYYSLYSMKQLFRKKWLPKATSALLGLKTLHHCQKLFNKPYRVHWCYISGQNDHLDQTHELGEVLANHGEPAVNIVRYNPFSTDLGIESSFDIIQRNVWVLKKQYGLSVKIVPRVGHDVNASCGMFL